jgi:hypothetical protein
LAAVVYDILAAVIEVGCVNIMFLEKFLKSAEKAILEAFHVTFLVHPGVVVPVPAVGGHLSQ